MCLHNPFSDGACIRIQIMKGLRRVVVDPAVGGLLGAAAFFPAAGWAEPTNKSSLSFEGLARLWCTTEGTKSLGRQGIREATLEYVDNYAMSNKDAFAFN